MEPTGAQAVDELHLLAPFGYFMIAFDGAILQANIAGAQMLGIPRAAASRRRLRDFVSPSCRDEFDRFFRASLNSHARERCRLELRLREGARQVALIASADDSGQACRIVVEPVQGRAVAPEPSEERLRDQVSAELRAALAAGQFELLYQPIVTLRTGAVHKAEALLRWRHPERGLLAPAEFLPFAESSGLIVEIGDWVLREAARTVARWQREIEPSFQVSINKSPLQFRRDAALYEGRLAFLRGLGLPAQSIVIEIGEGVLMDEAGPVAERLAQYRALGLQVALDGFGTGYSSLSYLKRFGIDYVKIDRSFAATIESDANDLALCEAIIVMAHKLGIKVVAEGVNTRVQRALLQDAGCDYAQGFMLGEPMTAAELEEMAKGRR